MKGNSRTTKTQINLLELVNSFFKISSRASKGNKKANAKIRSIKIIPMADKAVISSIR